MKKNVSNLSKKKKIITRLRLQNVYDFDWKTKIHIEIIWLKTAKYVNGIYDVTL